VAYPISTDVLGRVIEVASGMPLDQFLQERFFMPLDMKDTGFFVEQGKEDRFASIYTSDGKGHLEVRALNKDGEFLKRPTRFSGGGGLVSTETIPEARNGSSNDVQSTFKRCRLDQVWNGSANGSRIWFWILRAGRDERLGSARARW